MPGSWRCVGCGVGKSLAFDDPMSISTRTLWQSPTNRVAAGGRSVENDPKSETSRRTLPLPDRLVNVLRSAKVRQAAERLALGASGGSWDYVVSNESGNHTRLGCCRGIGGRQWKRQGFGTPSCTPPDIPVPR